jgi:hypothetical protein
VDSASIEVKRRPRRAKTDRLEVHKLLTMRLRHVAGEERVWSIVRGPSVIARRWGLSGAGHPPPMRVGTRPLSAASPKLDTITSARWPSRLPGAGCAFSQRVPSRRGISGALATAVADSAGSGLSRWRASSSWPCGGLLRPGSCRMALPSKPPCISKPPDGIAARRGWGGPLGRRQGARRGPILRRGDPPRRSLGATSACGIRCSADDTDTDRRSFEANPPHAFESPQHGRHPERSFGMLKRRARLSPKRRERRLDITGYIEGLLLFRLLLFAQRQQSHGGMPRRGPQ